MPTSANFFDQSATVQPPGGHLEPFPILLGPNRQPNDVRFFVISAYGTSIDGALLEMAMTPDAPTGFTNMWAASLGFETWGAYYRRLTATDTDDVTVAWPKPTGWSFFMSAQFTVRGLSTTVNPTAGLLNLSASVGDTALNASSVTVPGAGIMLLWVGTTSSNMAPSGSVATPVTLGIPTGWTNVVATDKSGPTFYPYANDPSVIVVGKRFTSSGTTGTVAFPTSVGGPSFTGIYIFLTEAADVSATIAAA